MYDDPTGSSLLSPLHRGYNRGMDERPSWGFWIAGTTFMLLMMGVALLPIFLLAGGKSAFYILGWLVVFLIYSGSPIAGVLVFAGMILLIVRGINRRRAPP